MRVICSVPVVVLFTKFDALLPVAMGKLSRADRRLPLQDRVPKAEPLIEEIFNRADAWGRLSQMKHAPKSCVKIGGLYNIFPNICARSHFILNGRHAQVQ